MTNDGNLDKDTQELVDIYRRRLGFLKKQKAMFGYKVDAAIVMEIEDIQDELKNLGVVMGVALH